MRACRDIGLRAFVGRCQMDRNAPAAYCEADAKTSCEQTRELIAYTAELCPDALVQPILTPRFALCCTPELLSGIADIAREHPESTSQLTVRIQTHISENKTEIATTLDLFPEASSYTNVYDRFGLVSDRTVLAHAIHLGEEEIDTLVERRCGVSHCPTSNLGLRSGFFCLDHMLARGVNVGLGTDVSAGYSLSMQQAVRDASTVSKILAMHDSVEPRVSFSALFYLATLGGAHVCGLQSRIGSFDVGKEFDAIRVNSGDPNITEPLERRFWRWLVCGDEREIEATFVRGVRVWCASDLL